MNDIWNYFPEVNGRKLKPHSELGLFSLPKLNLLDLSQPNSPNQSNLSQPNQHSFLPSGTPLVLPELLASLPVSLVELRVERRLIQGGLPSVQVYKHFDPVPFIMYQNNRKKMSNVKSQNSEMEKIQGGFPSV